jgi:hypothetical protein
MTTSETITIHVNMSPQPAQVCGRLFEVPGDIPLAPFLVGPLQSTEPAGLARASEPAGDVPLQSFNSI